MKNRELATILETLRPGAVFNILDGKITDWQGPGIQPTDEEINAAATQTVAVPSVQEQLDAIWSAISSAQIQLPKQVADVMARVPSVNSQEGVVDASSSPA